MDVVVISLRDATERREAVCRQLNAVAVPFEFFDAIPGTAALGSARTQLDEHAFRLNTCRDALPNELGCYASHRAVWQQAVDRNRPSIVLEDDFITLPRFAAAIPQLEHLMRSCDFVRLEPIRRRRAPLKRLRPIAYRIGSTDDFDLLYVSDVPPCLTAYAISPRGAAQLIRASQKIVAPVDKFVQHTWLHGVPVHALSPAIVRTSAVAACSTIGSRKHLKSRNPRLLLARTVYKGLGELRRIRFDRAQLARATPASLREVDTLSPIRR